MASVKRRLVYVAEEDDGLLLLQGSDTSPVRPSCGSQLHISPSNSISSGQSMCTDAGSPRVSDELHLGKGIAHKLVDPLLLVSYDGFLFADGSGTLRTPHTAAQMRLLNCALQDCRSFIKLLLTAEESSEDSVAVAVTSKRQRTERSRSRSCASPYHKHRRYGSDSSSSTLNSSSTYRDSEESDNTSGDDGEEGSAHKKPKTNRAKKCGRYRRTPSQPSAAIAAQQGRRGVAGPHTSTSPTQPKSFSTMQVTALTAAASDAMHTSASPSQQEGGQALVAHTNCLTRSDIRDTTVHAIRQQLRGYGLSAVGNKRILWRRLLAYERRVANRKAADTIARHEDVPTEVVANTTEHRASHESVREHDDAHVCGRESKRSRHSRHHRCSGEIRHSRLRPNDIDSNTLGCNSSILYAAPEPNPESFSVLLPASSCVPMAQANHTEVAFFSTPPHRSGDDANQEEEDDTTTVPLSRASSSSLSYVGSTVSNEEQETGEHVQQKTVKDEHSRRPSSDSATSPSQRSSGRLWQALVHVGSRLFKHARSSQQEQMTSDAASESTSIKAVAASPTHATSTTSKPRYKSMLTNRISLAGVEGRNSHRDK